MDALPFSTGVAVFAPGARRVIDFDDFDTFQSAAGFTRLPPLRYRHVPELPLTFDTTITLRDPLGDDQSSITTYALSLRDRMENTLPDTANEAPPDGTA